MRVGFGLLSLGWLLLSGCASTQPTEVLSDDQFGHRYEGEDPGGRRVIEPTPADSSQDVFYYPAVVDSLHIRPAPFNPDLPAEMQSVPVEVLVKGSFPDSCYQLDRLEQERIGNFINVTLLMRRPQGASCLMVVRPYRYYFMLEGLYDIGHYRMDLNGTAYPFSIQISEDDRR